MSTDSQVRDSLKSRAFFDDAIELIEGTLVPPIRERVSAQDFPTGTGDVSTAFRLFRATTELVFLRYSRGDDVSSLRPLFADSVEDWERSVATDRTVFDDAAFTKKHSDMPEWRDHYQQAVWLLSLAIVLEVDEALFDRVVASLDSPTDGLLDRLIAVRRPGHAISPEQYWPKPFAQLVAVIDAEPAARPALLAKFVKAWYSQSRKAYWWGRHLLPEDRVAKYFGYWCVEAAAVAAALGIDDRALVDNEYYPADLVPARWTKEK